MLAYTEQSWLQRMPDSTLPELIFVPQGFGGACVTVSTETSTAHLGSAVVG